MPDDSESEESEGSGGILESLSAQWESFLSWSDEKGLPLRGYSDALEERGIPPAPFFVALFLLILSGIGLLIISLATPQTATLSVFVRDVGSGEPIQSASVYLEPLEGTGEPFMGTTNSDGIATLSGVPYGKFKVTVNQPAYGEATETFDVESGQAEQALSISMLQKQATNCTLSVSVLGPASAVITLKDSAGNQRGSQTGTSAIFSVPKQNKYTVKAEAPGYSANSTDVDVGTSESRSVTISLAPLGADDIASVHVSATLADTLAPAANATISVRQTTGIQIATYKADSDGKANIKLSKGIKVLLVASYEGYYDNTTSFTADKNDASVSMRLYKSDPNFANRITCSVTDESGKAIKDAKVAFYREGVKIKDALSGKDGTATFDPPDADEYTATAFKATYLPARAKTSSGASCALALSPAAGNSGKVRVKAVDEAQSPVSNAAVLLMDSDGPLGIPESSTGIDGYALFEGVPLRDVFAHAQARGREGNSETKLITADGEAGANGTLLTVNLLPAKGTMRVAVIDHFTREPITGAQVDMTTLETASCATVYGSCSMEILEGWGVIKVSADGYSSFSSARAEVRPNVENSYTAELISSDITASIKPIFLGMFDLSGKKATTLDPSTTYNARFLISSPDADYSKAVLHVRAGDYSSDASALDAYVSGFEGGTDADATSGAMYAEEELAAAESENGNAIEPAKGQETSFGYGPDSNELKWVEFSYPKFDGTREAYVQIRTRQVQNGTIELGYRTAYTTPSGILRDPADAQAGKGKPEQRANVIVSKFSISFGGTCNGDYCLSAVVESGRGAFSSNFEARVPEEFSLRVKAIAPAAFELRVEMDTIKSATLESGSAPSASASIYAAEELQRAVIAMQAGNSEAAFKIRAVRTTNDLSFRIEANQAGQAMHEEAISGRLLSPSNNELSVWVKPGSLTALVDNKLTFTVTDASGTGIENAHIEIGSEDDILGAPTYYAEGTGEEGAGLGGQYAVEGVAPEKIGYAEYSVSAEGFAEYFGKIKATATRIIDVLPAEEFTVSVESKEGTSSELSVSNLLDNEVSVSAAISFDKAAKITDAMLSSEEFTLAFRENKAVSFDAWVSEAVLDVAKATRTLVENLTGKITFAAKVGGSKQTVSVPFRIDTNFLQQPLDDYWTVDENGAQMSIVLGTDNESSAPVKVTNLLSSSLLVNYQLDSNYDWFYYNPASIILSPDLGEGGTIVFAGEEEEQAVDESSKDITVFARIPAPEKGNLCIMDEEGQVKTNLTLVASIGGVTSTKKVPVVLTTESESDCAPDNGVILGLPLKLAASLTADAAKKENADGSVAIRLADKSRILFGAGSSYSESPREVAVPKSVKITLAPSMATITKPNEEFDVRIPLATTYHMDSYSEYDKDSRAFTLESGDKIFFPSSATVEEPVDAETDSTMTIKVPAYAKVSFKIAPAGAGAACKIDVNFGLDAQFFLPSGTQKLIEGGVSKAVLPGCSKVEFGLGGGDYFSTITLPEASSYAMPPSGTLTKTDKGYTAKVPAGGVMQVGVCASSDEDSTYEMTFGQNITFSFPKNARFTDDYTVKFASCESVVVATTSTASSLPNALSMEFGGEIEKVSNVDGTGITAVNVPADTTITVRACPCEAGSTEKITLQAGYTFNPGTAGGALKADKDSLAFDLSDGSHSDTQELCLNNTSGKALNVSATARNPDEGYEDASDFLADEDMYFSGEVSHSPIIPANAESCSPFSITARLPADYLDSNGCVKKDRQGEIRGQVKFSARLEDGQAVGGNLPKVAATISVKAGTCAGGTEAAADLNDVFINYDKGMTDVRTSSGMVLGFKDEGHERIFAAINNYIKSLDMKFTQSPEGVLECGRLSGGDIPEKIDSGEVLLVKCLSREGSADGKVANLNFEFSGEGYATKKISVVAKVYKLDAEQKAIYSSTPMGDVYPLSPVEGGAGGTVTGAPAETSRPREYFQRFLSVSFEEPDDGSTETGEETEPPTTTGDGTGTPASGTYGITSFKDCATHFCTYEQAADAYASFIGSVHKVIDWITADEGEYNERESAVCEKIRASPTGYAKSTILQMVNTQHDLDFLNSVAQSKFGTVRLVDAGGGDISTEGMKGCGIYRISAQPHICIGAVSTIEDFREKAASIDITVVKVPEAECKETLANAVLLTGYDPEVVTGNEKTRLVPPDITDILKIGGLFHVGIYDNTPSGKDKAAASALVSGGLGTALEGEAGKIRASSRYEDGGYCLDKGAAYMSIVMASSLAAAGLMSIPTSGASLIPYLGATLSGCGIGIASRSLGAEKLAAGCAAVCECPMAAFQSLAVSVMGGVSLGVPAKQLMMNTLKDFAFDSAVGLTTLGVSSVVPSKVAPAVTGAGRSLVIAGNAGRYSPIFNYRARAIRELKGQGMPQRVAEQVVRDLIESAGKRAGLLGALSESGANAFATRFKSALSSSRSKIDFKSDSDVGQFLDDNFKLSSTSTQFEIDERQRAQEFIDELNRKSPGGNYRFDPSAWGSADTMELDLIPKQHTLADADRAVAEFIDRKNPSTKVATYKELFDAADNNAWPAGISAESKGALLGALEQIKSDSKLGGLTDAGYDFHLPTTNQPDTHLLSGLVQKLDKPSALDAYTSLVSPRTEMAKIIKGTSLVSQGEAALTKSLKGAIANEKYWGDLSTKTGLKVTTPDEATDAIRDLEVGGGLDGFLKEKHLITDDIQTVASKTEIKMVVDAGTRKAEAMTEIVHEVSHNKLRIAAGSGFMILPMLTVSCDFRPTQAVMDTASLNHIFVFSKEKGKDPSTNRVCFSAEEVTSDNALSVKERKETCVTVDSLCAEKDGEYCIGLAKSGKIDGLAGYTLLLGIDGKNTDEKKDKAFIASVFDSTSPPVGTDTAKLVERIPAGGKDAAGMFEVLG